MVLFFLIGFLICEGIATVLGFEWFGTTAEDYAGFLAAGFVFLAASMIWPLADTYRRRPPQ